ncbi:hypothetical protein FDECE_4751 [Fusarium decemcellulare]|nr:hypothetical protein FDECE_4751 [Fusarium decemcellulare]
MSSSSELQREREVQGYFLSWQTAQGSSLKVARNVDSIAAPHRQGPGFTPQASPDKALTAFAQLAVFRLNVKRAMVSLIDTSSQIILAEATSKLRLGNPNAHPNTAQAPLTSHAGDEKDNSFNSDLWHTCTARDPNGQTYTAAGLIVPDCRLDPRFQDRVYVVSEPGVRFYAGVPIFSRKGHKVGVYAVSDQYPREGLTIDELQFMQGVAQAVMEHLEWARDRVDRFKGERIVRGLATFIESCSSDDPMLTKDEQPEKSPSVIRPPEMTIATTKPPPRRKLSHKSHTESAQPRTEAPAPASTSQSPPLEKQPKPDGLSRMYHRAAENMRNSTLADGVVLFGATASYTKLGRVAGSDKVRSSDEDDGSSLNNSGSESAGVDSSDSDTSPAARPCKVLAYALADEQARMDIEKGPALSLGTLEKYFSMFPKGKAFSFTDEGTGISSDDDSASDRELAGNRSKTTDGRRRKVRMDHKEFLKKIPGARSVVFLPLFDYVEDKLIGGCFLWTSVAGRIMNLDSDLSYLRAFGNSVISQVGRINTQRNEAAKTTFIASMSHELRSPLHGILGAAEFLKDAVTDSNQVGLVHSISTCGKTLLDTLNHVLDYSKINKLGRVHSKRGAKHNRLISLSSASMESLNTTKEVDLAILVEEVVDAITAGHAFKTASGKKSSPRIKRTTTGLTHPAPGPENPVSVLLEIDPRTSWMVKTQPGALRRIIMNLFGNALKYTSSGLIIISLRAQESSDPSKIDVLIRVADTGKGMSDDFQQNRLFIAFSQEDSFQPGTGLGLSIVKQIVDSLGGTLEVKSQQHKGTEIDVRLRLTPVGDATSHQEDDPLHAIAEQTKGQRLLLLTKSEDFKSGHMIQQTRIRNETLSETCSSWFGMEVATEGDIDAQEADILLYCEPPPVDFLKQRLLDVQKSTSVTRRLPIIVICLNEEEAIRISQSQTEALSKLSDVVEVVSQPCGPRKLAHTFIRCLERTEDLAKTSDAENSLGASSETEQNTAGHNNAKSIEVLVRPQLQQNQRTTSYRREGTVPLAPPQPRDPETPTIPEDGEPVYPEKDGVQPDKPHVLLVDDNKINLQLLVMFMKKCGFSYQEAENGQEAVERFKEASLRGPKPTRAFDYVLMDISMPVMNGVQATKRIREFEREKRIQPTTVFALTGLASFDAQQDAITAGVDIFLPKPVRFAELRKLITIEQARQ